MSYGEFQEETYSGEIVDAFIMQLKEHITDPVRLAKWGVYDKAGREKNPDYVDAADADHLIVKIKVGEYEKDYILGRSPVNRQGYTRSNAKKFIDKNELPGSIGEWPGLTVQMKDDAQGFSQVAL